MFLPRFSSDNFATQEDVFDDIGSFAVDNSLRGYNCSVFAYGQTGSGKTYTMMGSGSSDVMDAECGLIPRICDRLFAQLAERTLKSTDSSSSYIGSAEQSNVAEPAFTKTSVTATFLEIYNEAVRDLFVLKTARGPSVNLKVREHPTTGTYVEGLSSAEVKSFKEVKKLLDKGNEQRVSASTSMNEVSSRSHALFTLHLTMHSYVDDDAPENAKGSGGQGGSAGGAAKAGQRGKGKKTVALLETTSKLQLIDLAGSERAKLTGCTGGRLKEASSINQSLSALSDVIKKLAQQSVAGGGDDTKPGFIPYRNSVLTWLLKECLGGNSKTVMLAAVSPAAASYNETMSTLKYVERAKAIVNKCRVNDMHAANPFITKLRAEIDVLTQRLADEKRAKEIQATEANTLKGAVVLVRKQVAEEQARMVQEVEVVRKQAEEQVAAKEEQMVKEGEAARAREAELRTERCTLEEERKDLQEVVESLQQVLAESGEHSKGLLEKLETEKRCKKEHDERTEMEKRAAAVTRAKEVEERAKELEERAKEVEEERVRALEAKEQEYQQALEAKVGEHREIRRQALEAKEEAYNSIMVAKAAEHTQAMEAKEEEHKQAMEAMATEQRELLQQEVVAMKELEEELRSELEAKEAAMRAEQEAHKETMAAAAAEHSKTVEAKEAAIKESAAALQVMETKEEEHKQAMEAMATEQRELLQQEVVAMKELEEELRSELEAKEAAIEESAAALQVMETKVAEHVAKEEEQKVLLAQREKQILTMMQKEGGAVDGHGDAAGGGDGGDGGDGAGSDNSAAASAEAQSAVLTQATTAQQAALQRMNECEEELEEQAAARAIESERLRMLIDQLMGALARVPDSASSSGGGGGGGGGGSNGSGNEGSDVNAAKKEEGHRSKEVQEEVEGDAVEGDDAQQELQRAAEAERHRVLATVRNALNEFGSDDTGGAGDSTGAEGEGGKGGEGGEGSGGGGPIEQEQQKRADRHKQRNKPRIPQVDCPDLDVTSSAQRLGKEWIMAQRLSRSVRIQQQEYEENIAQLESQIVAQLRPTDAKAVLVEHLTRLQKQQALADKRLSDEKVAFEAVVAKLEKRILQHKQAAGSTGGVAGVASWLTGGRWS
jgi:hypothetical protein